MTVVLMALFGGDDDEEEKPVPKQRVKQLSNQGYSNSEITNMLRDEGFSYSQINKALNQAVSSAASDTRGTPGNSGGGGLETYQGEQRSTGMPGSVPGGDTDQSTAEEQGGGPPPPPGQQQGGQQQPGQAGGQGGLPGGGDRSTSFGEGGVPAEEEETIESVVAEYFTDVEDEFDNVYLEIDAIVKKMEELEERIRELEIRKEEDQEKFFRKMDELEDTIEGTSGRVGGLEKAFQDVLPSLVDNVKDLTALVEDMKEDNRSGQNQ